MIILLIYAPMEMYYEFTSHLHQGRELSNSHLTPTEVSNFISFSVDRKQACPVKLILQNPLGMMDEAEEAAPTANIASEVTITEPRARFTGTYSDIHVGRFRNQTVLLQNTRLNELDTDAGL
jgi:hypothetical protein